MKNYNNETDRYVYFWNGPFSNFWKTNIKIKDLEFSSSEQAFMFMKAKMFDPSLSDKILNTSNPKEAKRLGRLVKNYNEEKCNSVRYEIMKKILFLKFSQNEFY